MIHPAAKAPEQVNRKCCPTNTILQLSTSKPNPKPSKSQSPKDGSHASKQELKGIKAEFGLKLSI